MELIVKNINELEKVVQKLLGFAKGRKKMLFTGEIGAGKTTFIKYICKKLAVTDTISSPTFSIINEYHGEQNRVFHVDLYRLKNIDEAIDIGIEDLLYSGAYAFIEWAELIAPMLPEEVIEVFLTATDHNTSREITFKKYN